MTADVVEYNLVRRVRCATRRADRSRAETVFNPLEMCIGGRLGMGTDEIFPIATGVLMILAGIGFALVSVDEAAYRKDEKRFGPMSILNMGSGYFTLRVRWFRWFLVTLLLGSGLLCLSYGLGWAG